MAAKHGKDGLPIEHFASASKWEAWLAAHHADSPGLWVRLAKAGSQKRSVSRAEALDAALCYGWIDSQAATIDEEWWLQRFTPRGPKSKWSKINCGRATELVAEGRMKDSGSRAMEAAKADGRWEAAYDSPRTMTVPDDLQQRLEENPVASARFAGLNSQNRYAILYRIQDAKKPETRASRIEKFVTMLNEGRTIY